MQIVPYGVLEEIALGGQGVVYSAQDAQGQTLALELLLAHRAQAGRDTRRPGPGPSPHELVPTTEIAPPRQRRPGPDAST